MQRSAASQWCFKTEQCLGKFCKVSTPRFVRTICAYRPSAPLCKHGFALVHVEDVATLPSATRADVSPPSCTALRFYDPLDD